jgi:hypothetical protein
MIVGLCFFLSVASTSELDNRTLGGATAEVAHFMQLNDWASFRRIARSNIVVTEFWTAYADYFNKKEGFGGNPSKGVLGKHEFGFIGGMSVLANRPALGSAGRKNFLKFCGLMREAHDFAGSRWPEFPDVQEWGVQRFESAAIVGPCASFKVASNVHLGVEFDKVGGRYLVTRLTVIGH